MSTYYEKGTTYAPPAQATQQPYVYSQDVNSEKGIPQSPYNTISSQQSYSSPTSGIASLQQFDHVTIKQQVEQLEMWTGFETANKYAVLGPQGQLLLKCGEKSSAVTRYLLGANRPMDIEILDSNEQTVMRINRPFKLWKKNIAVQDGQGGTMGIIRKKFSVTNKKFIVENTAGQQLYTLEGGPIFPRKFKIMDTNEKEVGQILKRWGGIAKELFTDADTFTCFFPQEADTTTRALLVAATLFIDLTHFESKSRD